MEVGVSLAGLKKSQAERAVKSPAGKAPSRPSPSLKHQAGRELIGLNWTKKVFRLLRPNLKNYGAISAGTTGQAS